MAEYRSLTTGKYGGEPRAAHGQAPVAGRVDAAVDRAKAPRSESGIDCAPPQAKLHELPPRDHAVLLRRERGKRPLALHIPAAIVPHRVSLSLTIHMNVKLRRERSLPAPEAEKPLIGGVARLGCHGWRHDFIRSRGAQRRHPAEGCGEGCGCGCSRRGLGKGALLRDRDRASWALPVGRRAAWWPRRGSGDDRQRVAGGRLDVVRASARARRPGRGGAADVRPHPLDVAAARGRAGAGEPGGRRSRRGCGSSSWPPSTASGSSRTTPTASFPSRARRWRRCSHSTRASG